MYPHQIYPPHCPLCNSITDTLEIAVCHKGSSWTLDPPAPHPFKLVKTQMTLTSNESKKCKYITLSFPFPRTGQKATDQEKLLLNIPQVVNLMPKT